MKVVALFDGIGTGLQALKNLGIKVDEYHCFEIEKYALQVSKSNHPEMIHHGDLTQFDFSQFSDVDLLMGGSPCQGFSFAGKGLAFDDPRSKLFFEYVKIRDMIKPKHFFLENVQMKQEYLNIMTNYMGVTPITINSSLVSAQKRPRNYWCSSDISLPKNTNVHIKDILEDTTLSNPAFIVGRRINSEGKREDKDKSIPLVQCLEVRQGTDKTGCLTTIQKDNVVTNLPVGRHYDVFKRYAKGVDWRYLTPIELERLQTFPDNYTAVVSDSQRKRLLGKCWTVKVIEHIIHSLV